MKRLVCVWVLVLLCISVSAQSIDPVSLIIAKVIKALDLKIQKLQNETIWLQQAQQVAETELSKLKLKEIADWQARQQQLYADYFKELQEARTEVKKLPQVRQVMSMQADVLRLTKDASVTRMTDGITQSMQTLLTDHQSSMTDGERLMRLTTLRDSMANCLERVRLTNQRSAMVEANVLQQQIDQQNFKRLKP